MSDIHLTTHRLKRLYVKSLRGVWRYEEFRAVGYTRNYGLSKVYWQHYERTLEIKKILKDRGVTML